MIDRIEWVAGLLEGEGCFSWWSRGPHVSLKMTDRDVVEEYQRCIGHPRAILVRPAHGNNKAQYSADTHGRAAIELMIAVRPYMLSRRAARIDQLLEQWRTRPQRKVGPQLTHCKRGHEYDEANTYLNGGTRFCRACHTERRRERRESRGRRT